MLFSLNQRVVYPGHGVAKIARMIEKQMGGQTVQFYELKFLSKEMTVLVPVKSANSTGVRTLSSRDNIKHIFKVLSEPKVKRDGFIGSWNKRCKQYQFTIKSGDIVEISKIYRDLQSISKEKELSFGEKALLSQTESLLVEEISLVFEVVEEEAVRELRTASERDFAFASSQQFSQAQSIL